MAVRKGSMASAQYAESQPQSKYDFTYSKTVGASYIAVLTGTEIAAEATAARWVHCRSTRGVFALQVESRRCADGLL